MAIGSWFICSVCFSQFRSDSEFADNIVANTGRYEKLFSQAIDESLPEPSADIDQVRLEALFLLLLWWS